MVTRNRTDGIRPNDQGNKNAFATIDRAAKLSPRRDRGVGLAPPPLPRLGVGSERCDEVLQAAGDA